MKRRRVRRRFCTCHRTTCSPCARCAWSAWPRGIRWPITCAWSPGCARCSNSLMDDPPVDGTVPDPATHRAVPGAWPATVRRRQPGARGRIGCRTSTPCCSAISHRRNPRWQKPWQRCAMPAPGNARPGRWRWSAASSRCCRRRWCRFSARRLQAAWSHWLLSTPDLALKPGDSLSQCPACGSPAMAGVIRHRGKHNGLRYLVCSLCACEWHVVRVKCVYCEQSKGLEYVSLDRRPPRRQSRRRCAPKPAPAVTVI